MNRKFRFLDQKKDNNNECLVISSGRYSALLPYKHCTIYTGLLPFFKKSACPYAEDNRHHKFFTEH